MKFNGYFDNSTTSFPKPPEVANEIAHYCNKVGGPYGRSTYKRAVDVTRIVEATRMKLAELLHTPHAENIAFCYNATHAVNTILKGLSLQNSHILISPLEHNSVARTLNYLQQTMNITYSILEHHKDGLICLNTIKDQLKKNTKLVIINHVSNVNGVVQPIAEIKKQIDGIPLMVDAAQSLGYIPVNVEDGNLDFLVFTGHKSLLGPTGIGGFYAKDAALLSPFIHGGTGSNSEHLSMPEHLPDKFEAGTPNIMGIFGLKAALEHRPANRISQEILQEFYDFLHSLQHFVIYKASSFKHQSPIFSLKHVTGSISGLAQLLYDKYTIETRAGLHCAPLAHQTLGTFPEGSVRFSISPYHTPVDLHYLREILLKLDQPEITM